jgi:hypothetical protein
MSTEKPRCKLVASEEVLAGTPSDYQVNRKKHSGSIPFALWDGGGIIHKDSTQTANDHGPHNLPQGNRKQI